MADDDYILELLLSSGKITHNDASLAQGKAASEGITAQEILISQGLVSQEDILQTLASECGMEYMPTIESIPEDVAGLLEGQHARRYNVIPVQRYGQTVQLAISDPHDFESLDALRYILKMDVDPIVVPPDQINRMISTYYGAADEAVANLMGDIDDGDFQVKEQNDEEEEVEEGDAPIIRMVYGMIMDAVRMKTSDIHLEPLEKRFRLRYRMDGKLQEMRDPPKKLQAAIISRLKIMAGMSIAEKRLPQDGRISVAMTEGGGRIDLRVSTVPTVHGESIVMRILDKTNLSIGLPQLGFLSDDAQKMDTILGLPDGIFLVTGPTGSGKSTTLYACLNSLNKPDRKIITVEDPVEYQVPGINQVQVVPEVDMTFAKALRAMLRQAPNIIMVGEIRDKETATIAINASLTGHLVFSTLHTNDAPSAVTRLTDMGVKPFLVSSSIRAVMAQRLARKNCDACAQPYHPTEQELNSLGVLASQLGEANFQKGVGCDRCRGKGYRGRMGLFEIFTVDDEIRTLINDQASITDIRKRARDTGMHTLREDGVRKAVAGMTTAEEVISLTMGDKE